jgi:tetratricopeptide (TPR) repeat protein
MDERMKYSQLIERFVNGEMNDEQVRAFEKELAHNNLLLKEYLLEQELNKTISNEDMIEFRRKLNRIVLDSHKKSKVTLRLLQSRTFQYSAAASVVVLIAVIFLVFLMPLRISDDRLFSMYYSSDQPLRVTRSTTDIVEALRNYQNRKYYEAIQQFNYILEANPDNSAIRFYTGISYIETKQFDLAAQCFDNISNNNKSLYKKSAEWYLGLCQLKLGNVDKATLIFKQIQDDPSHDFNTDATHILEEIKKLK